MPLPPFVPLLADILCFAEWSFSLSLFLNDRWEKTIRMTLTLLSFRPGQLRRLSRLRDLNARLRLHIFNERRVVFRPGLTFSTHEFATAQEEAGCTVNDRFLCALKKILQFSGASKKDNDAICQLSILLQNCMVRLWFKDCPRPKPINTV